MPRSGSFRKYFHTAMLWLNDHTLECRPVFIVCRIPVRESFDTAMSLLAAVMISPMRVGYIRGGGFVRSRLASIHNLACFVEAVINGGRYKL